jgi:hypothetical protein
MENYVVAHDVGTTVSYGIMAWLTYVSGAEQAAASKRNGTNTVIGADLNHNLLKIDY